jgi:hypothetical protein
MVSVGAGREHPRCFDFISIRAGKARSPVVGNVSKWVFRLSNGKRVEGARISGVSGRFRSSAELGTASVEVLGWPSRRAYAWLVVRRLLFIGALLAGGCSGDVTRLGAGEPCLRTSQCDLSQGLACSGGICTTDLSGLEEAGMVAMMMDGGPVPDAPMVDGGMVDGGMMMMMDSGPMGMDSGPMGMDSGPMGMDSGPTGTDGGPATD